VRYIEDHQVPDQEGPFYVISILENFSRSVLASDISRTQDQEAYLKVLHAAIFAHGAPEAIVTDGGAIFRCKAALLVYEKLSIRKEQIETRQAWQNYIEAAFSIQRRMADYGFALALSWQAAHEVHERWLLDYNNQAHWAHRKRTDGKLTPLEVLNGAQGVVQSPQYLRRVFRNRYGRFVNRFGCIRFRRWRLYGEVGLGGQAVAVWLTRETLTVEYEDLPLAQYQMTYEPDTHHLREVEPRHFFDTNYAIPRLLEWNGSRSNDSHLPLHAYQRIPIQPRHWSGNRSYFLESWANPLLVPTRLSIANLGVRAKEQTL
jgi:putative transposase